MSGYGKTFKVKDGDKDKNNKLMFFRIDAEKLLEKLNALPFYDNRYIKSKIITYGDKVYVNYRGLSIPEDDIFYM